jgi:HD-like signal output (HDOD) protein
MVTFLISTSNELELSILKKAFSSMGISVLEFKPDFQYCLKMMQYIPNLIIIEIPRKNIDEFLFIKNVKKRKVLQDIPIFGYGNSINEQTMNFYCQQGLKEYFIRPLSFTNLLNSIPPDLKKIINSKDKQPLPNNKSEDIEILLDRKTLPSKKIDIIQKHISNVMAFPFTVSKVLKLTADKKAGADDLAKVISTDPIITANILKVSNTIFFAGSNRRITSVKDAIVRIGFNETRKIVLSMSVMELLNTDNKNVGFNRVDFWYHSLACALFSERIARKINSLNNDIAFLAGLLHDFGIILLDEFFPDIFTQSLEKTTNEGGLFIEKVNDILGITHNDVIEKLFMKWKLPEILIESILNHHLIFSDSSNEKLINPLSLCVALGNILAKTICFGMECDQFICPVDNNIFSTIKMLKGFNPDFLAGVFLDIKTYRNFLKLEERDLPYSTSDINRGREKSIGFINHANDLFLPPVLYFGKENISVSIFNTIDNLDNNEYDIIIIWAGDTLTLDGAMQILQNYKKSEKMIQNKEKVDQARITPVLFCLKNNSNIEKFKNNTEINFILQHIDMRLFDMQVVEMISEKGKKSNADM